MLINFLKKNEGLRVVLGKYEHKSKDISWKSIRIFKGIVWHLWLTWCSFPLLTLHHKGSQLGGQLKGHRQSSLQNILFDLQEKLIPANDKFH